MRKDKLNALIEKDQKNGISVAEVINAEATLDVAVREEEEEQVPLQLVKLSDIDSLEKATVAPIDLMSEYWAPQNSGESKRVVFDKISITHVLRMQTPEEAKANIFPTEIIPLECAFFFVKEGTIVKRISNGSKRLVGRLKEGSGFKSGMALEIIYFGKKKNTRNGFSSANWGVFPLIVPSAS